MSVSRNLALALAVVILFPALLSAQESGIVSYRIDGREYTFDQGRVEYYPEDGYISLTCETAAMVENPSGAGMQMEMTVGMTIQLACDETDFMGIHRANTPDIMPTYFSWYEIVPTEDGERKEIREYLASLDSGDEDEMEMILEIMSFGPPGGMVTGTFNGSLFDEEGTLHKITEGSFSVPRIDM